jgi:hypothetical protein
MLWIRSKGGDSRNLTVVYYLAVTVEMQLQLKK